MLSKSHGVGYSVPHPQPPGWQLLMDNFGISDISLPRIPPPPELELLMEDFVSETGMWRLITVSPPPVDTITFFAVSRDTEPV